MPLILIEVLFQGLVLVFQSLILAGVPFQGLVPVFPPLILVEGPFQGVGFVKVSCDKFWLKCDTGVCKKMFLELKSFEL